ncbi:hypothetical protein [Nostoc sp. FACHB-145]|uniref:hypothetical protein n=1 Tax=Nostoc sp. FACHB-145 TaxID=2692836 RepID=UPI001682766F|nr:hypothetical protein [Nostoc sp. FACHB-145]MBD2472678.1 hypothetical protein [Nostoc sp. FACHB-145]
MGTSLLLSETLRERVTLLRRYRCANTNVAYAGKPFHRKWFTATRWLDLSKVFILAGGQNGLECLSYKECSNLW